MKNRKRVGIARFSFTGMLTLCCVITLSQQGCSSDSESPDPAAVRAAIAEASEQEQQLIRSTIDDPERLETFQNALMLNPESADNLISSIEAAVPDEARQQTAVAHVNEWKSEIAAFERLFSDSGKQLNHLAENHEDTADEIKTVHSDLNDTWEAGQARALDERFELRKSMTEKEWQKVFGPDSGSQ